MHERAGGTDHRDPKRLERSRPKKGKRKEESRGDVLPHLRFRRETTSSQFSDGHPQRMARPIDLIHRLPCRLNLLGRRASAADTPCGRSRLVVLAGFCFYESGERKKRKSRVSPAW